MQTMTIAAIRADRRECGMGLLRTRSVGEPTLNLLPIPYGKRTLLLIAQRHPVLTQSAKIRAGESGRTRLSN